MSAVSGCCGQYSEGTAVWGGLVGGAQHSGSGVESAAAQVGGGGAAVRDAACA